MSTSGERFDCSVVIPAHNAEGTIEATIHSVLGQHLECLEVIVIDDGSQDSTRNVVEAIDDERVRLLATANAGPSAARNAGIAVARGRYVAFLDSDDLWLPTYLTAMARALRARPRAGFGYTDAYVFEGWTGRVRRTTAMRAPDPPPPDRDAFLMALLRRNFVFTSTTVSAAVLAELGGYDESLLRSEDYDLWLRVLVAGYDAVWVPGPQALYRYHATQISGDPTAFVNALAAVYQGLNLAAMPSASHRDLLTQRRAEARREIQIVNGEARWASRLRSLRHKLGRLRRRADLTYSWYPEPPAEVTQAFGSLSPRSAAPGPEPAGQPLQVVPPPAIDSD